MNYDPPITPDKDYIAQVLTNEVTDYEEREMALSLLDFTFDGLLGSTGAGHTGRKNRTFNLGVAGEIIYQTTGKTRHNIADSLGIKLNHIFYYSKKLGACMEDSVPLEKYYVERALELLV